MRTYIDTSRIRTAVDELVAMQVRLTDLTVPLTSGAKRAYKDTLTDFNTAGIFSGEAWADLAESTRERDQYDDRPGSGRPTSNHDPLVLSGRFRNSLRYWAQKFEAGLTLGPAYWLNTFGTTNPNTGAKKNPDREAGYISEETINATAELILAYAVGESSGEE